MSSWETLKTALIAALAAFTESGDAVPEGLDKAVREHGMLSVAINELVSELMSQLDALHVTAQGHGADARSAQKTLDAFDELWASNPKWNRNPADRFKMLAMLIMVSDSAFLAAFNPTTENLKFLSMLILEGYAHASEKYSPWWLTDGGSAFAWIMLEQWTHGLFGAKKPPGRVKEDMSEFVKALDGNQSESVMTGPVAQEWAKHDQADDQYNGGGGDCDGEDEEEQEEGDEDEEEEEEEEDEEDEEDGEEPPIRPRDRGAPPNDTPKRGAVAVKAVVEVFLTSTGTLCPGFGGACGMLTGAQLCKFLVDHIGNSRVPSKHYHRTFASGSAGVNRDDETGGVGMVRPGAADGGLQNALMGLVAREGWRAAIVPDVLRVLSANPVLPYGIGLAKKEQYKIKAGAVVLVKAPQAQTLWTGMPKKSPTDDPVLRAVVRESCGPCIWREATRMDGESFANHAFMASIRGHDVAISMATQLGVLNLSVEKPADIVAIKDEMQRWYMPRLLAPMKNMMKVLAKDPGRNWD
jgi:hypothetical protein